MCFSCNIYDKARCFQVYQQNKRGIFAFFPIETSPFFESPNGASSKCVEFDILTN